MSQIESKKRPNPLAVMFRAAARPFSYIFPAFVLVSFVMSLLSFRISDPGLEVGYAALLYVLALFWLGGMYSRDITVYGLVTLFAVPVMLFFVSVAAYWPVMLAAMPAIQKAFRERDRGALGKAISISVSALLVVSFIPVSIMSCDAYSTGNIAGKQAVSPDGSHMVQVSVAIDTSLGGRGRADLYGLYPLSLQRRERVLAQWQWVPLEPTRRQGYADTYEVDIPLYWKDTSAVVMGDLVMDVYKDPVFVEKDD